MIEDYAAATQAVVEGRLKDAWCGSINLVTSDQSGPLGIVEWYPARAEVVLHRTLRESPRLPYFAGKIPATLAVLERVNAFATGPLAPAAIPLNLDDIPSPSGVAFVSAKDEKHLLIPDPNFVRANAYADLRRAYANPPQWKQRIPVVFWRGGTSGRHPDGDWRKLQRLQLCRIGLGEPLIDAGITHVAQLPEGAADEIGAGYLRRGRVPAELFHLYRAHIAIDGNSWPTGFYCNLLTGAPVLKIASAYDFRQWYYDRLKPWVHYVPVAADLSDLTEKCAWVLGDGARAARIGEAGRAVAWSMTVAGEIGEAAQRIARLLSQRPPAKPVPTAPSDQPRIVQSLLKAYPEKTRLIFVHIPKCAGTDLSATLKHFPAIHQTLSEPSWQKPETLKPIVEQIEQTIAGQNYILVHGHIKLQWVLDNALKRPGDRLFAIVRDPEQQLISQINYVVNRLMVDPTGKQPDTAWWLRRACLSTAENCKPADLLEIARTQVQSDPTCWALGDGTTNGALKLIRESAIEITDTDRYSRWGLATWSVPFNTRHNTSKKSITEIDKAFLKHHCAQDIDLYGMIRATMGEELFIRGDQL